MSSQSPRRWVTVLGAAVSALFLWVAVRHLDLGSVRETWRQARPLPWVPLAMLAYVVGHFVRGARLKYLVRREAKLQLTTATNVVVVGYASNNVLPARLGELVRAGMLAERTGIPLTQALTVTFIERLVDGVAILFLLIGSNWATHTAGWIAELARVGALVFGLALCGLGLAVLFPTALSSLASRLSQPLGTRAHDTAVGLTTSIVNGAACLRRPLDAAAIGALSIVVWLCESAMFALILPALGLRLELGTAVIAMSVTNLGILVPSTPGFVGPFHFFCSQALQAQGTGAELALAYAVLVHIAFYVPATLWGAGAMLWYGVEVGATAALARAARRSPRVEPIGGVPMRVIAQLERREAEPGPTEFDVALTEALLPPGGTGSGKVVHEAARFLAGQIAALPTRVRTLYGIGMSVFRFWVRVRYLRSFCALSLERRRAAAQSWAFGSIAPLRQLFRAPRSTVLLAFYEHPEGLATLGSEERRHLPLATAAQLEPSGDAHG
jgi:uncharacterized protein (TIRG00374 family)